MDRSSDHLGVPEAPLLGHSHGGFVAQYHALHHPDRLAGVILYESAPVTGPEAVRLVQEFAARHADNPGLPEVVEAFQNIPAISDDAGMTAVARGIFPAYFAEFRDREAEFGPARAAVTGTFISGLDADLTPDVVDDRATLGALTVPRNSTS
ncbi:alpha/beta fold hydrolase [Streptomyces sp. cg40]|uniref:alpha/beta fold hydrolase n=1 Tax=Streptomyces sp. cg40 TaxID=3419764 RepID=UPI003D01DB3C